MFTTTNTIEIQPEYNDRAKKLSSSVPGNFLKRIVVGMNATALFCLEGWVDKYAPNLKLDFAESSLFDPQLASVIDAVLNVKIGEFKICIITVKSFNSEKVNIPRAVVDIPKYNAHFYLLVEIWEEDGQAILRGVLHYNKLIEQFESANLVANKDWTYDIPLSWFDPNSIHLLSYCSNLEPSAIQLPTVNPVPMPLFSRPELNAVLSQLKSPNQPLWKIFTWEQGKAILSNPEYLKLIEEFQQASESDTSDDKPLIKLLREKLTLLMEVPVRLCKSSKTLINDWLKILEEYEMQLAFELPQSSGFMPAETKYFDYLDADIKAFSFLDVETNNEAIKRTPHNKIVEYIREQDMEEIPQNVSTVCLDFTLDELDLRFSVTHGFHSLTSETGENLNEQCTSLFILGTQSEDGSRLPGGMQMKVSTLTEVLEADKLESENYLICQSAKQRNPGDKFIVTITTPSGNSLTFPPFIVEPN